MEEEEEEKEKETGEKDIIHLRDSSTRIAPVPIIILRYLEMERRYLRHARRKRKKKRKNTVAPWDIMRSEREKRRKKRRRRS